MTNHCVTFRLLRFRNNLNSEVNAYLHRYYMLLLFLCDQTHAIFPSTLFLVSRTSYVYSIYLLQRTNGVNDPSGIKCFIWKLIEYKQQFLLWYSTLSPQSIGATWGFYSFALFLSQHTKCGNVFFFLLLYSFKFHPCMTEYIWSYNQVTQHFTCEMMSFSSSCLMTEFLLTIKKKDVVTTEGDRLQTLGITLTME